MRDPDLVVRAQQAGVALESAWRRWRNLHGLGDAPLPPVSSYVGYSLDAPWGQPRVVFGISAEDAEQLAALLERQDRMNPVPEGAAATPPGYEQNGELPAVSVTATAGAVGAGGTVAAASTAGQGGGYLHVPAPAPASSGQQPLPASAGLGGQDHAPPRHREPSSPSALTSPSAPGPAGMETPIALAASRAVGASMASRKRAAGESSPAHAPQGAAETPAGGKSADHPQDGDDPPPDPGKPGQPGHQAHPGHQLAEDQHRPVPEESAELPGRRDHAAEHGSQEDQGSTEIVAFRPRAESALGNDALGTDYARVAEESDVQGPGFQASGLQAPGFRAAALGAAPGFRASVRTPDGPERGGLATASADAATWAAGELPGQAAVTDTAV